MQRNKFLKLVLAAAGTVSLPVTALARFGQRVVAGFKVGQGKDRSDKPLTLFEGDTFYTKIATSDTDGDIFMFESVRKKNGGPPLHFHPHQDEWWYILSGEFLVKIGDDSYNIGPGDSVFGPRGVPHAFAKTGEGDGKLLMFFQPAGKMEVFFQQSASGAFKNLSVDELNAIRTAHGFTVVGPALQFEKK